MSTLFVLVALFFTVASSQATTETGSDIVTEILQALKGNDDLWRVADYLNSSRTALVNELPLETSGRKLSYTFFAPTSMAFLSQMPQGTVDPLIVDGDLRTKVLIRHFARQRVSASDLDKLDKLVMADSKEAVLTRTPDTQANVINEAEIQPGAIQLPDNIGTIYTVNRVFMTSEEVSQAISAHFERNPNTGFPFFG